MQKNHQTMTNMQDNANSYQLTLKEEFETRRCQTEGFYNYLDIFSSAIDGFVNYANKYACFSETLCLLLNREVFIDQSTYYSESYIKMLKTPRLLRATSRTRKSLFAMGVKINKAVGHCKDDEVSFTPDECYNDDLRSIYRMIFNKQEDILRISESLSNDLLDTDCRISDAEQLPCDNIAQLWNEQIARYESDNAQLYESFCHNVINAVESLRELDKERERNEDIELWYRKPEPCEFIKTLRAQADKVELDLLPVFDYEIKRRRLLDMMRAEPLKSGGKIVVYGDYNDHSTTNTNINIYSNEHVVINPNLRTVTHNHGER